MASSAQWFGSSRYLWKWARPWSKQAFYKKKNTFWKLHIQFWSCSLVNISWIPHLLPVQKRCESLIACSRTSQCLNEEFHRPMHMYTYIYTRESDDGIYRYGSWDDMEWNTMRHLAVAMQSFRSSGIHGAFMMPDQLASTVDTHICKRTCSNGQS